MISTDLWVYKREKSKSMKVYDFSTLWHIKLQKLSEKLGQNSDMNKNIPYIKGRCFEQVPVEKIL